MPRRLLISLLALGVLLVGAPASAQPPPVTTTTYEHNATETFIDVVPSCTPDPNAPAYEITLTYNEVEHITDFGDGRVHETFTQTGTFVAVPVDDPSLPSYTGTFTVWGGFNANGKTVNGTLTMTVHGTGSGGSSFKVHETDHFKHHAHGGGSSSSPAATTEPGKPRQLAPGVAGPLPIRYGVSLSGDGAWPHPLSGRVAIRASGFTRLPARPTAAAHRSRTRRAAIPGRRRHRTPRHPPDRPRCRTCCGRPRDHLGHVRR